MNWGSSILWGIVGLVGGAIITFCVSLIFYLKSIKKLRLRCEVDTYNLFSSNTIGVVKLNVKYKEKDIAQLKKSTIAFKNVGNAVIEKDDIAPASPIAINTDGIFFIDETTTLINSNDNNNAHLEYLSNKSNGEIDFIMLNFDYIGKNDEIKCTVLHTAPIKIQGALKDGYFVVDKKKHRNSLKDSIVQAIISAIISALAFAITYFIGRGM